MGYFILTHITFCVTLNLTGRSFFMLNYIYEVFSILELICLDDSITEKERLRQIAEICQKIEREGL